MYAFVMTALAVMVGTLMAGVVATLIVYNTPVMKWLNKKAIAMGKELAEEYLEDMEK